MKTWHTIIYAVTYKNSNIVYIHLHIFERNGYIIGGLASGLFHTGGGGYSNINT